MVFRSGGGTGRTTAGQISQIDRSQISRSNLTGHQTCSIAELRGPNKLNLKLIIKKGRAKAQET